MIGTSEPCRGHRATFASLIVRRKAGRFGEAYTVAFLKKKLGGA